jgi:signal-transduction protein with cAMP-binding, CBS, and nucleotidyltransferase domain
MKIKEKYYENRIIHLLREYNEKFQLLTESKNKFQSFIEKQYNKQINDLNEKLKNQKIDEIEYEKEKNRFLSEKESLIENAVILDEKFGPLSLWIGEKIGEFYL